MGGIREGGSGKTRGGNDDLQCISSTGYVLFCCSNCALHLLILHLIAVSQAGKREELLAKTPSREASEQVHWIWAGMLIELDQ